MKRKHVSHVKYRRYFKRKRVVDLVIMSVALGLILIQLMMPEKQQALGYDVDIPEEAIWLRILAHSDDAIDQAMKHQVRDVVSRFVANMMGDVTAIQEARDVVTASLPEIEQLVHSTLTEREYPYSATVTYGENIVFPTKVYDTHVYPQEKEIDEEISVLDNNESEDKVRETEALSKTKDQGETKPKAKFWLVEQISKLIHKFCG